MSEATRYPALLPGDHDHDRGLAHDLEALRRLDRRRALGLMGLGGSALALSGCGGGSSPGGSFGGTPTPSPTATATPTPTPTATTGACTAYAAETNGPFPADGTNTSSGPTSNVLPDTRFQRSELRQAAIPIGQTAAGVDLRLTLTLANVNGACAPLAGHAVYIWHCNALGQYSLYDLPNETYLRGVQVSDANGRVSFTSVVPGCYAGRYPHIHFEVFSSLANATSGRFALLVSQIALPAAMCTTVYGDARYGQSLNRFNATSIAGDNVFGDNSAAQQAAMTLTASGSIAAGYDGTATIGLAT